MEVLNLLEKLASMTHHDANKANLISVQPIEIQKAFLTGDGDHLNSLLAGKSYMANTTHVVQG